MNRARRNIPVLQPSSGLFLAALAWLTLGVHAVAQCPIQLHEVTPQTGIAFRHTDGESGKRYIVETVCCGLATFDYDGDGKIDIYFLNGRPLQDKRWSGPPPRNALYRNLGNWKFADVTQQAGVDGGQGYGLGVAVADYDNDGHPDIYLNNFGSNTLYRNSGKGGFVDVTAKAGVADGVHVGAGTCFLDIDRDGLLDLYVSHYVNFTFENHHIARFNGYPAYVGPMDYQPTRDTLFRNRGDGTFVDVSKESGVAAHAGTGMGMIAGDFDDDGDTDILVGNDEMANFLFQNDGAGKFEEAGLAAGLAYDVGGTAQGTMGIECGDYDNDGLLDVFMTAYQQELPTLYRAVGHGLFEDVTRLTGAGAAMRDVKWGLGMIDFDNDGHRDLFIACGHLHDNVELFDNATSYHARNVLLRNTGDGRFVDITDQAGDGMQVKLSSRGAAFDDLDNDGDIDVVVLNSRREPTILRNMLQENGSKNHWLEVQLRGTKSNRDAVGARVKVVAGKLALVDEVHSGRGYQSHYGTRLHFGLGARDHIDRIEVRWLGGEVDVLESVGPDRLLTIVEGSSRRQPTAQLRSDASAASPGQ